MYSPLCSNTTSLGLVKASCYIEIANVATFGFLAYFCLLLQIYLRCSKKRKGGWLLVGHWRRSVLSLCLLLVHFLEVAEIVAGSTRPWLQPILAAASWLPVQTFYATVEAFGVGHYLIASSGFYLLCGLARGVLLYSLLDIIDFTYIATYVALLSSALCYAISFNDFVTLVAEAKLEKEDRKTCSGEHESYMHHKASWFSRVTFFWLTPLLWTGYSSPLELEDLGKLPPHESTTQQFSTFMAQYNKLKTATTLPSLWQCYTVCHWRNFLFSGLLKLIGDLVGLVPPLGISVVIDYVASIDDNFEKGEFITVEGFIQNGYVMTGIVFLSALAQGSFSQASTHIINVEGIRLKTALQGLLYTKALRMSPSNKDDDSVSEGKMGNATNLISEDTFNVMSCIWIGHYVWAIPLKIAVLMYLLYCKLGVSAIIGASCCIAVMTPLQFYIGKRMSDNSKLAANCCDERLRMTNEMLQGIRVLKLCAWETKFCSRITAARNQELKFLDRDALYWALMTCLAYTSSILITVVTLGAYYNLEGSYLSTSNVFSALAFFNQLTVPLFIFPITVPIIISAIVSTRRIEDFLALPETTVVVCQSSDTSAPLTPKYDKEDRKMKEIERENVFGLGEITEEADELLDDETDDKKDEVEESKSKGTTVALIREAAFSWGDEEKPTLWINNLHIPKGKLTVVIGRVGSGKSSLLSALLGEMKCASGLLKWEKGVTMAYVSQQPWIMNASLRENILFGLPYNQRRFTRVISATALQRDIELLPNKDLTELGEKGVNLSGGQRQRIAIARALYSKSTVVILDDPLSALDYHVAQHVFDKGIKKLVARQRRTVIMVTHSLHLLTHAHQITALESGRVRACGKLRDMEVIDGVVTGIQNMSDTRGGRTARERWQLVKLVSRIGHHIRQQNQTQVHPKFQARPLFIPLRKRQSRGSDCYWTQDLPLPNKVDGERDFPLQRSTTLPRHRPVGRATSLQPHSSTHLQPVTRQASSPTINQGSRPRNYTFDGVPQSGNLLKQLFSMSSAKNVQGSGDTPVIGSFKEKNILRRLLSSSSIKSTGIVEPERHHIQRLPSTCSDCSEDYFDDEDSLDADWCGTNSTDEREYGKISPRVYLKYAKACGLLAALLYIIFATSCQAMKVYSDFWLSDWTHRSPEQTPNQAMYYLTVYTGLSLMCVLISLLSTILGQYCGATARRRLHKDMLLAVVRLPINVFDVTPLGRILARFSTDIGVIDKKLATSIQRLAQFLLLCFSAILVNSIVTPWFLILAVPICLLYYAVQKFYRSSSRELQRLDSMSRTPILSHFTETISGLEIIRAFKQQQRFTGAMFHKMDTNINAFLITNSANRWLGIALDYLGAVIVLLAMIVSLVCASLMPTIVTPALVGLAINYTLLVPIYLNWVVKFLTDVEMYMAGVERITQYTKLELEDYKVNGVVPPGWPLRGEIKFEYVSLRYDRHHDIAITNLNLCIPPGQKVGICGRTGSGKSSLVMSLFGMVPVVEGSILIDGVDISSIPLQVLRSRLSVIPQDVIMYSGTIRENLDLENRFSDAELWESLEMAQMKETVSTQLGGLNGQVREGGVNLSTGQRQLLCLARAILHKAALLIMDEATSSLDTTTEKTLLHAAENAFANKTVLTIAHRLGSLLSCDRIIVLESGRIVEDGPPNELLNRSMGIFSTMLRTTEQTH